MQQNILSIAAPLTARCATRTLALSMVDAAVTLPAGGYELLTASADVTVVGFGVATTSLPSSTETTAIAVIPAGGVATLSLDVSTALHARCLSGTGVLYIVRKALP